MPTKSSGFLIQSNFGAQGNFELVATRRISGMSHIWRDNDNPSLPWSGPNVIAATGTFFGPSLIQSNFGTPGRGNLELVVKSGDQLLHFWREDQSPFAWSGPTPIASGVTGNPALIQGAFGSRGNFELVVPLVAGGIGHFWRDNDGPLTWHGPTVFAAGAGEIRGVALIQSDYGSPGNLEVVATLGSGISRSLAHFWRDDAGWHGPISIPLPGISPDGVPGFVQAASGDFEVVVGGDGHLTQVTRNNSDPALPWSPPTSFAARPATVYAIAGLIQSNYGPPGAGNLELVARKFDPGPGVQHDNHYWRTYGAGGQWNGPSGDLPA